MRLTLIILFICSFSLAHTQSATEIIRKADEKMRGKTSQGELIIRTTRPSWSREMRIRSWMKGNDFALLLVQSPPKDKGIVFLKRKKEVWNWMPILERVIKLPPSMMTNSWMGTDFTNDDLVKESSVVNDYQHRLLADTTIDGKSCYRLELIPKPNTAVVWGKLLVAIDKKDFLELYTEFFDEEGKLTNTMRGYDIKLMDGRLIPTRVEMIPADKKGHKTEIIYLSVQFNRNIDDNFFSIERIKQFN
ncbi:MAG: outer membrane lipoprotein-sorting protein [Chitinophagaceae bacterium]|nr:outer membrane lipoprotein-sorting protein [Chitinophagaceae bacterium]MEA3424849.1 outer membrane lipoprotein-sorting protein [Bacteroidota bacterium]MCA6452654.1 outer membrane lipoprotein-sorting protein [Chitinophagaceae bacterium]MCA6455613.1 outer membrane lipoprotein-sorting protein [Chitinophagaceae bacterium]MCA6458453.1 outer membrane lipoprotein-sorting protein [Chitinophagaceae bacterium]